MRSVSVSSVSSSSTGTATWAMIGPVSTPPSTKNSVAPATFTPYASASRGPWMPGKAGSSALWVFTYRSPKRFRNSSPTSFRNPAETTRSGRYDATDAVSAASHSVRSVWSFTRSTKVGTPARSARRSPSMPSRSAPTATTSAPYAGSAQASSRACRLVPAPETRTSRRVGALGRGTADRLPSDLPGDAAPAPPGRGDPADQAAEAEADRRGQQRGSEGGADVGHPPGADRAAGDADQHGGEHAAE